MKKTSFHFLRVGLAITFLWIGVLIFKNPEAWGGYLQPWAVGLLPIPLAQAMIGTAILDIAIGAFLLIDFLPWLAALAIVIDSLPQEVLKWFIKKQQTPEIG